MTYIYQDIRTMSILSIDLNVKGYIVWQDLSGRSLMNYIATQRPFPIFLLTLNLIRVDMDVF